MIAVYEPLAHAPQELLPACPGSAASTIEGQIACEADLALARRQLDEAIALHQQGDSVGALQRLEQAAAALRASALGSPQHLHALAFAGDLAAETGDLASALGAWQELAHHFTEKGDEAGLAVFLHNIGVAQVSAGDPTSALASLGRAICLRRRQLDNPERLARSLVFRGLLQVDLDERDGARAQLTEGLAMLRGLEPNSPLVLAGDNAIARLEETAGTGEPLPTSGRTRRGLIDLASQLLKDLDPAEIDSLPTDLAARHDHYIQNGAEGC